MATKKEYFYFIDSYVSDEQLAFVEKGSVTRNGWSSDYKTIQLTMTDAARVRGSFLEDDLTINTLTGSYSNIPSRFHSAIVSKVIAMGYKDPRHMELKTAQFFDNEFEMGVKRAKKFSKSNYQTVGKIVAQDF